MGQISAGVFLRLAKFGFGPSQDLTARGGDPCGVDVHFTINMTDNALTVPHSPSIEKHCATFVKGSGLQKGLDLSRMRP